MIYVEKNINSYKDCVSNLYIIVYKAEITKLMQSCEQIPQISSDSLDTVRIYKNNIYKFILIFRRNIGNSWLKTLPRTVLFEPKQGDNASATSRVLTMKPETPVIIAASDVGGAEREHTSRDDNSSKGHPGTPAVLHDGSLPDTPLKAQDLKAEGTRASTLCRREATSQSLPHPSGRFYPSVFHVRSLLHTLPRIPPRRPFVHALRLFIAGMAGSLSLHGFGCRKESRTRFHVDAHRKQLNSTPGRFAFTFWRSAVLRGSDYEDATYRTRRLTVSTCALCTIPYRAGRLNAKWWTRIFFYNLDAFNDFLKFEMNVKYGIYERKNIV